MTYKFKPINKWLLESLVNSTIYVPSPKELNDPFDCLIDVDYLFSMAIDNALNKNEQFIVDTLSCGEFKNEWKRKISEVGVYSCCIDESILKEHLMWAHYADKHSGVCIKYNDKFANYINTHVKNENDSFFGGAVTYGDEKLEDAISSLPKKEPYFSNGLSSIYLKSKAESWKYEKEGRFILARSSVLALPPQCIDSIYFGLKTVDADIELVTKLASLFSGCTKFYKARRGGSYYGISFEEIPTHALP